ncbi:MAG: UxaA family hydrolase [Micromonosporaceae bacterium]
MSSSAKEPPGFLAHRQGDNVAVAVRDLTPGEVEGGYLKGPESVTVELLADVPLGHKFALAPIADGAEIIEYGVRTGIATRAIGVGEYVHVHNVRSARWQTSVA